MYRGTGGSLAKAQAEFTTGVMKNETVRQAAADAAQAQVMERIHLVLVVLIVNYSWFFFSDEICLFGRTAAATARRRKILKMKKIKKTKRKKLLNKTKKQ